MTTALFGSSDNYGPSYSDIGQARRDAAEAAISESEKLIIRHIELATDKKHVVVNGEDKYIPLDEAVKLGLASRE